MIAEHAVENNLRLYFHLVAPRPQLPVVAVGDEDDNVHRWHDDQQEEDEAAEGGDGESFEGSEGLFGVQALHAVPQEYVGARESAHEQRQGYFHGDPAHSVATLVGWRHLVDNQIDLSTNVDEK